MVKVNKWYFFFLTTMFLSYSSSHDFPSATVHLLNGSLSQSRGWMSDWFVFTIRLKELYT